MMDNIQKVILNVIKSAIKRQKSELEENFNFDKVFSIAKKHGIIALLYYGLLNCEVDKSAPIMQQLFLLTCQNVAVSEQQIYALRQIFSEFDKNQIDYMPLKGTLLKELYPKSEMRSMGDADILIKEEQYRSIKPIMEKLGYTEKVESNHELIWTKKSSYIELHKRLIPSYNKDYFSYYGEGWRLAKNKNGTRFSMTDEDQMIYLFTHFAKHYRDAGIGLRHIVDLWVYRNSKPDLNEEYIRNELKKLQLYDFYVNIIRTLAVWFEDVEPDDKTDLITDFIFNSGVYGTSKSHNSWETLKISKKSDSVGNIKTRKVLKTTFLSYQYMCIVFPVLKKAPYLLPIFWVVRIIRALLFRWDSIKKNIDGLNIYDLEMAEEHRQALNMVGLYFDFKE